MEKRLQLLLDARRYSLVSDEAERTGRSVAAVIREAIDMHFAVDERARTRAEAAQQLLELTESPLPPGALDELTEFKQQQERDFDEYVAKKAGE